VDQGAEPRSGFRSSELLARHAGGKFLDGQPGINAVRKAIMLIVTFVFTILSIFFILFPANNRPAKYSLEV